MPRVKGAQTRLMGGCRRGATPPPCRDGAASLRGAGGNPPGPPRAQQPGAPRGACPMPGARGCRAGSSPGTRHGTPAPPAAGVGIGLAARPQPRSGSRSGAAAPSTAPALSSRAGLRGRRRKTRSGALRGEDGSRLPAGGGKTRSGVRRGREAPTGGGKTRSGVRRRRFREGGKDRVTCKRGEENPERNQGREEVTWGAGKTRNGSQRGWGAGKCWSGFAGRE